MSFLHYWKQASDPNISSIETHGTRQGNWRFHSDSDSTYIEKNRLNGTYIPSPSRDGLWPPPPPPPPLPHPFLFEFEEQTLPPTPPDFWLSWAEYFWDNTLPTRVCTKFSRCDLGISFSDIWMTTWTLLFGFMCMFFFWCFFDDLYNLTRCHSSRCHVLCVAHMTLLAWQIATDYYTSAVNSCCYTFVASAWQNPADCWIYTCKLMQIWFFFFIQMTWLPW